MKPFSPLKPLIAAMFVLAAASAGAQTVTYDPIDYSFEQGSLFSITQEFNVANDMNLGSFTFIGSQLGNSVFGGFILSGDGLDETPFDATYSEGIGWTVSGINQQLTGGNDNVYTATMFFTTLSDAAPYGSISVATGPYTGKASYAVNYENSVPMYTVDGDEVVTGGKSFQYTVTAVPEPESYAMMLAGLGLMGAIARRRSRKV